MKELRDLYSRLIGISKLAITNLDMPEQYLTSEDVMAMLKVSKKTLSNYRNKRMIPFISIGGIIRYKQSDLDDFIAQHQIKGGVQ